jgi:hypothetical protein
MAHVMISAARELGLVTSRGGFLKDGKLVYLQMPLPTIKIGNSDVERLLTSLNSHDRSTMFGFGSSNVVVVCQNTFRRAYTQIEKFRHTAGLKERVEVARQNMIMAMQADAKQVEDFKVLSETKLSSDAIQSVMTKIFDLKKDAEGKLEKLSTQRYNQLNNYISSVEQSVKEQGDSLWAVFNGVTRYVNHIAAPKDESEKQAYLMTGRGAELSNIAFDELMSIVTANTVASFAV